jgi:hypothetical protein
MTMQLDAVLNQLGYTPNEALREQAQRIIDNTHEYEKIQKHMFDLHNILKVDNSYIAMSNSHNYFKIKIEALSEELKEEAIEKIKHFCDKFKVELQKVEGKDTYYIIGFSK